MATMKIKKGDTVRVIAGADKGAEGKVVMVDHKKGRVVVEGVNMVTKHTKPSMSNQQGGIVHQEAPIDASNVMLVVDGQTTRVGFQVEYKERENGSKKRVVKRVAKATGKVIDD
ncbi:MAG: 50S ribosomal protein L24 [Lachnospiraceae bacterium]|nr:50S ribosomal protein L24 [Lachnospiraceae bacterium]MCD8098944.1 50S ribosomal protein L24 [Lachnospiraceae bacterium]MCD8195949.1 50S ribosomal protein L24 [Lachnospiraceae bacterium]MCD8361374.1 50S ribosomal protein L24 [Lachnospiraceae bacterium]